MHFVFKVEVRWQFVNKFTVCNLDEAFVFGLFALLVEDVGVTILLAGIAVVSLAQLPYIGTINCKVSIYIRLLIENHLWNITLFREHQLVKLVVFTFANALRSLT